MGNQTFRKQKLTREQWERIKENERRYYWKHREKRIAKAKKWNKEHPEKHKEGVKKWIKTHWEKAKQYLYNSRAKRKKAKGKFTLEEWENKKREFNYKCAMCGISEKELLNKTGIGLTVDHIIPLSKGGTNNIQNIQPLCLKCNRIKNNKCLVINTQAHTPKQK
jgi:5-methylcytosine-specific restriction endonuclease McrA